ncbi:MAG: FMN-binding protein, partial [Candidatus Neomarinimicrobiota bacterium]|nr:FMN-binding protein [Candidatus Neomarinimicrobiota bacterium]
MHSNRYTLIFTTLVTMILAFILSSAYSSLEDITNSNIQADIKKNILSSLGFAPSNKAPWTTENVEQIFQESIVSFVVDKSGNVIPGKLPQDIDPKVDTELYPLYKKIVDGKVDGFAIPISGKGLWGTMYGYFAIEPDGATAKGITFYKHIETPGLG